MHRLRNAGATWIIAGTATRALGQWALLWLLIRIGGPEAVGTYGLASAWVIPLIALFNFDLSKFQSTDAIQRFSLDDYARVRALSIAGVLLAVGLQFAWASRDVAVLSLALCLQLISLSLAAVYQAPLLQHGYAVRYGRSLLAVNATSWTTACIVFAITSKLSLALLISTASILIITSRRLAPSAYSLDQIEGSEYVNGPKVQEGNTSRILREALPYGLWAFIDSVTWQLPRFFVQGTWGTFEVGLLVGFQTLLSFGSLLKEALASSVTPRVVQALKTKQSGRLGHQLLTFSAIFVGAGFLLIPVVIWVGPHILVILLGSAYASQLVSLAFVTLIVAIDLVLGVWIVAITAIRKSTWILLSNLLALVCVVAASLWLIPVYGVSGAMASIFIALMAKVLLVIWLATAYLRSYHHA